jgi:hypothetical protein
VRRAAATANARHLVRLLLAPLVPRRRSPATLAGPSLATGGTPPPTRGTKERSTRAATQTPAAFRFSAFRSACRSLLLPSPSAWAASAVGSIGATTAPRRPASRRRTGYQRRRQRSNSTLSMTPESCLTRAERRSADDLALRRGVTGGGRPAPRTGHSSPPSIALDGNPKALPQPRPHASGHRARGRFNTSHQSSRSTGAPPKPALDSRGDHWL